MLKTISLGVSTIKYIRINGERYYNTDYVQNKTA